MAKITPKRTDIFLGPCDEKIFLFRSGRPPLPTTPIKTLAVLVGITTTVATLTKQRDLGNLSDFWSKSLLNQCLGATQPTTTKDGNYVMCLTVNWIDRLKIYKIWYHFWKAYIAWFWYFDVSNESAEQNPVCQGCVKMVAKAQAWFYPLRTEPTDTPSNTPKGRPLER